jgi:hypothetical protein
MLQQLSQEQEVIYAFPPPIRKLVESLLQLMDSGPLEVVLVVPLERTAVVTQALKRGTSVPLIFQRSEALLLPPTAYGRHKEISYLLSKLVTWKALIRIRLSGRISECEDFRRSWQQQCRSSTRSQTPVETGVHIMRVRSSSYVRSFKQLESLVEFVSTTLCLAM